MNQYIDILLLITSILASGFPIFVFLNSNRTKINRAKRLVELLEYRAKIRELRQKETEFENAPLIKEKLDTLLLEIDEDFKNRSEKSVRPNVWLFIVIVSIEIFFAFNTLSTIILSKSYESGLYFLEGVFKYPSVRIIGLLIIFSTSFWISFRLINWLKVKFHIVGDIKLSLYLTLFFNVIFLCLGILITIILALSDDYISWF
jgi:hypothetical protein